MKHHILVSFIIFVTFTSWWNDLPIHNEDFFSAPSAKKKQAELYDLEKMEKEYPSAILRKDIIRLKREIQVLEEKRIKHRNKQAERGKGRDR